MNEQPKKLDTHFIKNDDFKTVYGSGFLRWLHTLWPSQRTCVYGASARP